MKKKIIILTTIAIISLFFIISIIYGDISIIKNNDIGSIEEQQIEVIPIDGVDTIVIKELTINSNTSTPSGIKENLIL